MNKAKPLSKHGLNDKGEKVANKGKYKNIFFFPTLSSFSFFLSSLSFLSFYFFLYFLLSFSYLLTLSSFLSFLSLFLFLSLSFPLHLYTSDFPSCLTEKKLYRPDKVRFTSSQLSFPVSLQYCKKGDFFARAKIRFLFFSPNIILSFVIRDEENCC